MKNYKDTAIWKILSSLKEQIKYSILDFKYSKKYKLCGLEKEILSNVRKNGYYVLPNFIDPQTCEMLREEVYNSFEKNSGFLQDPEDVRLFGIDTVSSPIYKLAQMDVFKNVAKAHVSQCFAFAMASVLKFDKTKKSIGSGGGLHRDTIYAQIKFMIYLTDCNENNGYFELIEKSHLALYKALDTLRFNLGYNNNRYENKYGEIIHKLKSRHKKITGTAGTLIVFDNSIMHTGHPIKEGERVALALYFARTEFFESLSILDKFMLSISSSSRNKMLINEQKIRQRLIRQLIDKDVIMELNPDCAPSYGIKSA